VRRDDPRIFAVVAAVVGLVDALATERRGDVADELVPFPFGFERRAASTLVRQGKLASTKIGRRTYARRSDVLALVSDTAMPAADAPPLATDAATAARAAYASPLRVVRGSR
jgi:hypothetical protein